jgi:hypothetical protein
MTFQDERTSAISLATKMNEALKSQAVQVLTFDFFLNFFMSHLYAFLYIIHYLLFENIVGPALRRKRTNTILCHIPESCCV